MKASLFGRRFWWRCLLGLGGVLVLLLLLVGLRMAYAFRDRSGGYTLDVRIDGEGARQEPRPLRVGFGRAQINPDLSDPERPVWLAGFNQHRAATAIHDDLWSVACVVDDGHTRIGLVSLDAIGLFHDEVIEIRRRLQAQWKIGYAMVCTTHNHSTPDLMGLWGPDYLHSGVDPDYRERVITRTVEALGQAAASLAPARVACYEIDLPTDGLLTDTRKPAVYDPGLRLLQFLDAVEERTLGSVVAWANHPETPWARNTEITSDFPGYLREALEKGIRTGAQEHERGWGGIHLYVNGAIGGLLSTTPGVTVRDPYLNQDFQKPSHEKARALGRQLAWHLFRHLEAHPLPATNHWPIAVHARTLELPLDNAGFLIAPVLGLIDRGHTRWNHIRSEVAVLRLGDVGIACVPGEIYPELVNGGIERAPGGDFDLAPVETPPLRELMPGRVKLVFGLANDEIGYIIPKSEWDEAPPYLYGSPKSVYGEINSLGPETAPRLHQALAELCGRFRTP